MTYSLTSLYLFKNNRMKLCELLKIKKGITSVIGGGGKTTLLHLLADELKVSGSVIITTTTHIMKSDFFHNVIVDESNADLSYIKNQLEKHRCICVGSIFKGDKLKEPLLSIDDLCEICDYVLVEADGSRHLPLKAHLEHEPVILNNSTKTVLTLGIDALGKKLEDVTHRAQRACDVLSCGITDIVTADMISRLVNFEGLADIVLINKCDNDKLKKEAEKLSRLVDKDCIVASLVKGEWYVSGN